MSDPTSIKTPFKRTELLIRSHGYRLLAALLRRPYGEEGCRLQGDLQTHERRLESLDTPWKHRLARGIEKLSRLLPEIAQNEWVREYEYCFGHTAHSKVSAYELEYGGEHSRREPQELADIAAFYQAFGLQVREGAHERGDHIHVESEFMHFLTFTAGYALERGENDHAAICEESASRFLSDHLARWAPVFAVRLRRTAQSDWMKAIADFSLCFILTECEMQGIEAGDPDMPLRVIEEKVETGCVSCALSPLSGDRGNH